MKLNVRKVTRTFYSLALLWVAQPSAADTQALSALSFGELQTLQQVSAAILEAPSERTLLEVRGSLTPPSSSGERDAWSKALEILVDHRLTELQSVTRSNSDDSDLSPNALAGFLDQFAAAYDTGDLAELMELFEPNARSNGQQGRDVIEAAYRKLFAGTQERQIRIRDVSWNRFPNRVLGRGNFDLVVTRKGQPKPKTYTGNIVFSIAQQGKQLQISDVYYSACEIDKL